MRVEVMGLGWQRQARHESNDHNGTFGRHGTLPHTGGLGAVSERREVAREKLNQQTGSEYACSATLTMLLFHKRCYRKSARRSVRTRISSRWLSTASPKPVPIKKRTCSCS